MFTAIRNFFAAPRYEGNPERTQDAQTTHRVAIALLGLALFSVPFILQLESPIREFALYGTVGGLVMWLFTIGLVKRGRTNGAKLIILAINTSNLFAVTFATGGFSRSTITTTLFLLALATLLFPRRGAINYGAIILALATVLFFMGRAGLVPEPTIPSDDLSIFYIFTFTLISVASLLAIASANARRNLNRIRESQTELRDRNIDLKELTEQLEMRVEERTAELEVASRQVERRAEQFEAIAQVSRIISSIQDQEELLPRITRMISQYFGFYHVGVFLLDEDNQYAVLRAANSEGGGRMLARKHRLEVGQTGIVGYVTSTGNPRITLDTGADAVYFNNPDLPETHSEMALPLKAGGRVIGALDVQSTEPNAFAQEDINILSTLADQVSSAIQNARLYEESREALAQAETAYRRLTGEAWANVRRFTPVVGYRFDGVKPEPLTQHTNGEQVENQKDAFSVPVQLRGESIGRLRIKPASDGHQWTEDEIAIIRATAERVAMAAENARLVLESQKSAAKEQIIGEISSKIGASINLDNILQTTLREMGRILPGAEISIQVENE